MKKEYFIIVCVLIIIMTLSACGSSDIGNTERNNVNINLIAGTEDEKSTGSIEKTGTSATDEKIPDDYSGINESTADKFGNCGNGLQWFFKDGIVVIRGIGEMDNYDIAYKIPWIDYEDEIETVVIEDGCRHIGDLAFSLCSNLSDISMTDSVKTIGQNAFCYANIERLELPEGVRTIRSGAFSSCKNLKEVVLPEGIQRIEGGAFRDCENLTDINFPDSIIEMGSEMLSGTAVTDINIPSGMDVISGGAFRGLKYCKSIEIPNNITKIERGAFSDCEELDNVTIPESIELIEREAFYECPNLKEIKIPNADTYIKPAAFEDGVKVIIAGEEIIWDNPER